MTRRSVSLLLGIALLPLLLGLSGGTPSSPVYRFTRQSGTHVETVLGWMLGSGAAKLLAVGRPPATTDEARGYFSTAGHASSLQRVVWEPTAADQPQVAALSTELAPLKEELESLKSNVELLIQNQVASALMEADLGARVAGRDFLFPPLLFRFESLPKLLVVSPRARIHRTATVLLNPSMGEDEAGGLEESVAAAGFSALVTHIGGLGVYPSMVPESSDIRFVLRTVAHEWVHQFLALRPLGWRYAFGSETDPRMVTVNETVAEIVGREIGDAVYRRYYRQPSAQQPQVPADSGGFRSTLRALRLNVEVLLAQGKVDEAEALMGATRQELARAGYYIRKLNQAYFAFHGSYADSPTTAGGVGEGISRRLHALRESSGSLGQFLWRISEGGSYEEFRRIAPDPGTG